MNSRSSQHQTIAKRETQRLLLVAGRVRFHRHLPAAVRILHVHGRAAFSSAGRRISQSFFTWHPWLYLFLVPAVGMRMWSEERRLGTIELLLTMPITPWQAIVGKFLASWAVARPRAGAHLPGRDHRELSRQSG